MQFVESHLQNKNKNTERDYKEAKNAARQALRAMENNFWRKKCEDMQFYANRGDTHKLYKAIKHTYGPKQSKNLTQTFIKKDGNPTSSPIETLQRLKEYYSELLNRQPSIHTEKVDMYIQKFQRPICWELDNEPTMDELRKIFFSMKNHKTTSVDMIPVEIHKYAESKILKTETYKLVLECWNTSVLPEVLFETILCSLYKGGNKQLCTNQRGITLISHFYKALSRIFSNRASNYCEKICFLPESQSAFRKNRSTNDMVFAVRLLQYSCMEKDITLFLGFIDIAKAYDSVHRPTLWKILSAIGIPPKMLALIKALYGTNNCKIKFGNKLSEMFSITAGLKQGCPAACLLFNIFFAVVIHIIKEKLELSGIELKFRLDGDVFNLKRLYAKTKIQTMSLLELLFADDAAVCANSAEDLQIILQVFYDVFAEFGLEMALKKTQVLVQRSKSQQDLAIPPIAVDGKQLQIVNSFKYLGSTLTDNASNNKEICLRNQKAVASFSKLYQRVWKKKHLSLKTKAQVYRTIVFPNLTYGCETWTWTRSQMSLLEGTQYRFLRTIAGKTWKDKVPYTDLINQLSHYNANFEWAHEGTNKGVSITAVETFCRLARLRYAGHVARMTDARIPKIMLYGEVNAGQRKPGRPKKSFREGLKEDLKAFNLWEKYQKTGSFEQIVATRDQWRSTINQNAQAFQRNWELNRKNKSNLRKERK